MRARLPALALLLASVASAAAAQEPTPQPPTRLPPVVTEAVEGALTVENRRSVPVAVYMEYGRFDRRLGVVAPAQSASLALPRWAVEQRARVQLFAHAEGDVGDYYTEEFTLREPGRIHLVIPSGRREPPPPRDTMQVVLPPEDLASATLTVDNPRSTPVTIFAQPPGPFDIRLGAVPAASRVTLRFPASVVIGGSSIRVLIDGPGARDLVTETLRIEQAQHLALRVPPE